MVKKRQVSFVVNDMHSLSETVKQIIDLTGDLSTFDMAFKLCNEIRELYWRYIDTRNTQYVSGNIKEDLHVDVRIGGE